MRYIFIGAGTHGDVLPLIGLADMAKLSGVQSRIIAPAMYRDIATHHEIDFCSLASEADGDRSMRDIFLLTTRYSDLFFLRHAVKWNGTIYEHLKVHSTPDTIVVTCNRGFLWADIFACAHLGLPIFRALIDPPGEGEAISRARLLPATRIQHWLAQRYEREWRQIAHNCGLTVGYGHASRLRRTLARGVPGFGLYPAWLAGQSGRAGVPALGFCLPPQLPDHYESRLPVFDRKRRLVVFVLGTTGTTASWGKRLLTVGTEACQVLDCNGLFVGHPYEIKDNTASGRTAVVPFVALDRVLQGAHAIVHHGGIGTAALAIRNAVAQVLIPRVFSQLDNADLLRRAGAALVLSAGTLTRDRLVTAIENAATCATQFYSKKDHGQTSDTIDINNFHNYIQQTLTKIFAGIPKINDTEDPS